MPGAAQPPDLRQLQEEIEDFIRSHSHPVVSEDEAVLFDLKSAGWRLTAEYDKLLFEVWNPDRSVARRVEAIVCRDHGRLGLFVRKSAGKAASTLEIRDMMLASRPAAGKARGSY